jgi:hypothetical protein
MKKILLATLLVVSLGYSNQTKAQCSGAVIISNFAVLAPGNQVFYSFDWQFVQGNASIQIVDSCNGVFVAARRCLPTLKDSTAGVHHITGSFPTSCSGVLSVALIIWTNNSCGGNHCTAANVQIEHITLPVTFSSFNAARNRSNVVLKWETATEVNNSGFAVERNINGAWEQVAFVASQGLNGNSSDLRSYQFTDVNNTKGITQYRIKQIDLDLKSKYTEVRAIRGEGQTGKTIVYPNPTNNGKVTILFEDANVVRNITVVDMSGRTVKQLNNISNNNITIDNLTPGLYSVRIVAAATGEQTVEKIIVNKR